MMKLMALALLISFSGEQKSASGKSLDQVIQRLNGFFVTSERPDDYSAIIVWKQEPVTFSANATAMYHERATVRSLNRPYNQQVWTFEERDHGILLRHYDVKNVESVIPKQGISKDQVEHLSQLDMMLNLHEDVWVGEITFQDPEYLSRFVALATSARVSLRIYPDAIEYHLVMFNEQGQHIYGPRDRGYRLVRR